MRRYEKYKDSWVEWIGKIPEGWEIKKVKYLLNDIGGIKIGPFGSSLKLSTLSNRGIKIYGQSNIIRDDFSFGDRYLPIIRFEEEFMQYEIHAGDVLVTMMGTTGKSKIFKTNYERGILDSHLLRLRFDQEKLLSEIFVIILQESVYITHQIKLSSKGSIMEGLNSSIVKELEIVTPPFTEQTAIVNYLDRKTAEIDKLISQKQRLIELYEEEKTAIINQAVTRGIDPDVKLKDSGIEWLGEIPEGWQVIALKRLVTKITDGEHISPKFTQTGMQFLSAKDVRDGYVRLPNDKFVDYNDGLKFRNRCNPERNDILLVSRGATVGRVAIIDTDAIFCLLGSVILLKPKKDVFHLYLFFSLKNKLIQEYFLLASQSSAQQAIYLVNVATVSLAIPPLQEQIAIVNHIETETARIDAKIAKTKRIIELQKEYRTALISEVVTGKIKVTEEAAS